MTPEINCGATSAADADTPTKTRFNNVPLPKMKKSSETASKGRAFNFSVTAPAARTRGTSLTFDFEVSAVVASLPTIATIAHATNIVSANTGKSGDGEKAHHQPNGAWAMSRVAIVINQSSNRARLSITRYTVIAR